MFEADSQRDRRQRCTKFNRLMLPDGKNLLIAVAGHQNRRQIRAPFSQHRYDLPSDIHATERITFNNKQAKVVMGIYNGIEGIENIRFAPDDTPQTGKTSGIFRSLFPEPAA